MKQKHVTIKDIAKATNFSYTTVSRILNNKDGASKENAERVKRVAKELGYRPNVVAKSLRLNSTKTIGVIVFDCSISICSNVIRGIEDEASKNEYSIILCNTDYDYNKEYKSVKLLAEKRVDGIIIAAPALVHKKDVEFLNSIGIPVVFIFRRDDENIMDYVITNNELGSYMVCDFMLKKGYKDIVCLNLQEDVQSGQEREKGFKKALEKNGIEFRPEMVFHIKKRSMQIQDGYNWLKELIIGGKIPRAVFCGNDIIATGVIQAALEYGLKVPDDLSIAGFDDINYAEYLQVPLTTVRQQTYAMGNIGAKILLKRIKNEDIPPQQIIFDPELIIRKSV